MRIRDWSSDVCSSDLVLSGEGVDGEPSHAELQRALDGIEERLLPRRVALCALQAAPGGPAPVPVHDARDVRGDAVRIDSGDWHAVETNAPGVLVSRVRHSPVAGPLAVARCDRSDEQTSELQ